MATHSSILAWKIPWWAIVHVVAKSQARLSTQLLLLLLHRFSRVRLCATP